MSVAIKKSNGRMKTGIPGKYVILGWKGMVSRYGCLGDQRNCNGWPILQWEDHEIVGTAKTKKAAVMLMRDNSQMGNKNFYELHMYLNDQ